MHFVVYESHMSFDIELSMLFITEFLREISIKRTSFMKSNFFFSKFISAVFC
jgi:hypothetical protein